MPPRIPARQSVELVQLGFLLPWVGRQTLTSSTASKPTQDDTQTSLSNLTHAESSKMASSRAHPPISAKPAPSSRKRIGPLFQPDSPSSVPNHPSIIHKYLSSTNPPPPSTLLNLLKANSRQYLTISSGKALSTYCIRMGNFKSYRGIWRLMGEKRVATMGMVKEQLSKIFPTKKTPQDNTLNVLPSGDHIQPKYKYRPNTWAIKTYPPLSTLPSTKYRKVELLKHLHWLLLQGDSPDFKGSLDLYKNSIDYNKQQDGYQLLPILNLYLAYLNRLSVEDKIDGMELSEIYLQDSVGNKVNKQTLHLLIKSLIPLTISRNSMNKIILEECTIPSHRLDSLKNEILATISYFLSKHKIIPGPETYRILSNFAIRYKIDELGELCWQGWNDSLIQLKNDFTSNTLYPPSKSLNVGGVNSLGEEENLSIRFKRIGNYKRRWTGIIQMYEQIGWLGRSEQVKFGLIENYVWLGEKGRLDKLALARTQLQDIKQVEEGKEVLVEEMKLDDLNLNLNQLKLANEPENNLKEIKVNIEQSEAQNEPIIQVVKEETPNDVEIVHNKFEANVIENYQDNNHHKPPYFVLIRDGSTVKIKSRNSAIYHSNLDEIDDKPVWE